MLLQERLLDLPLRESSRHLLLHGILRQHWARRGRIYLRQGLLVEEHWIRLEVDYYLCWYLDHHYYHLRYCIPQRLVLIERVLRARAQQLRYFHYSSILHIGGCRSC